MDTSGDEPGVSTRVVRLDDPEFKASMERSRRARAERLRVSVAYSGDGEEALLAARDAVDEARALCNAIEESIARVASKHPDHAAAIEHLRDVVARVVRVPSTHPRMLLQGCVIDAVDAAAQFHAFTAEREPFTGAELARHAIAIVRHESPPIAEQLDRVVLVLGDAIELWARAGNRGGRGKSKWWGPEDRTKGLGADRTRGVLALLELVGLGTDEATADQAWKKFCAARALH